MESGDRTWIAIVSFYHLLDRNKSRAYMRRNLDHVLDCHERQLAQKNSNATNKEATSASQAFQSISRPISDWTFPRLPEDMIRDLIRGDKPTLTISTLSLRVQSPQLPAAADPTRALSEDPDWLPRPDELRIPCQITVAFHDLRSAKKQIYLDSRRGTVTRASDGPGDNVFQIKLEQPFRIEKDELSVVIPNLTDTGSWQRGLDSNCTFEIGIQFARSAEAADFLSEIEGRRLEDYASASANEGIVKATWTKFPELPDIGELLPLKRAKGHKSLDLRYSVEVGMSWSQPCSPVVRLNRVSHRGRHEPHQLPTPTSDDLEEVSLPCTIKYLFRHNFKTRSAVTDDLKCLFCPTGGRHSTFDRLRLHFLTHHEHLRFEVDESAEESSNLKIIRLSPVADGHTQDDKVFDWEAPLAPFDISAQLSGESLWQAHTIPSRVKTAVRGVAERSTERPLKATPDPPAEQILVKRAKRMFLPPEEVEDLPQRRRRKHEVPNVPGIKFYRTTSKQQILPGTLISESDEEPEESWFEQAARSQLIELGLDQLSLDFNELFNKQLNHERPMSDTLTRDAVVRFARKFQSKLRDVEWAGKFFVKLELFKSRRVIGQDTVDYCRRLLFEENGLPISWIVTGPQIPWAEDHTGGNPTSVAQQGSPAAASPARKHATDDLSASASSVKHQRRLNDNTSTHAKSTESRFGHRTIRCTRPSNGATVDMTVAELTKDKAVGSPQTMSEDDIEPSDLEWSKFLRFLDLDLIFHRGVDNIVCISNGTRIPVVDGIDWVVALMQIQTETTGVIHFELCQMDHVESGYEKMTANDDPAVSIIPQKRRNQESLQDPAPQKKNKAGGCTCGKPLNGVRGTIACGNVACGREFHMQCVQLQKRLWDWRCMGCSTRQVGQR